MKSLACVVLLSMVLTASASAQAPVAAPTQPAASTVTFDVASVKASDPNAPGPFGLPIAVPMILPLGDRLTAQNATLRLLVRTAYAVEDFQIIGGPSWQNSRKFDVNAKASGPVLTAQQLPQMLKALLADRFQLKTHTETREGPVSALVLAQRDGKLGPRLKPSTATCPDPKIRQQEMLEALAKGGPAALASLAAANQGPCSISQTPGPSNTIVMHATGQSISVLLAIMGQLGGLKNVKDQTGLTGLYDWDLTLDIRMMLEAATQQLGSNGLAGVLPPEAMAKLAAMPDGPTLQSVLQQELGLKIDSQKGPVEYLVIDSAELPAAD